MIIKTNTGVEELVELSADSTVSDLAREAAEKFGDEKTKKMYDGFRLLRNSSSLSKYKNKSINSLSFTDNTVFLVFVYPSNSSNYFSWDGKLVGEKEEKQSKQSYDNFDQKKSSWSLPRIIVGVIDLLLLAATAITFLLFFLTNFISSIVIPIVLTILFVAFTILFFGGNSLLPRRWLGNIDFGTGFFVKNQDRDEDKYKREGINPTLKIEKNENEEEQIK